MALAQMTTDSVALINEARNFERIADELKSDIMRVEHIANELDTHWQGAAAKAAKAALARFHEAAQAQIQQLNEITTNLHTAATKYATTDDERAGAIARAMGSAMGGPVNGPGPAFQGNGAPQTVQVRPATATNAANGHRSGVQFVGFGAKQDGGAAPTPGYDDPFNPSSTQAPGTIGMFPVPPQVAATAPQRPPEAPPQAATLPATPAPSGPSFGQCVGEHVQENIGTEMVEDGFKTGVETAIKAGIAGAVGGGAVTAEAGGVGSIPGGLGGVVLGFVGGFGKGLLEAPLKAAGEGAWDCAK
jgi:WXG100 family type VII secretion target